MTWDLRERVLLAMWAEQGHEFRRMNAGGAALCLRCDTIVHVRKRALAMSGEAVWATGKPAAIRRCKPKKT